MEQYYKKPTQWKPRKETQSSGVVVSARITGQTCGMRQRPDEDEQRERDGGGEAAQEPWPWVLPRRNGTPRLGC